MRRAADPRVEVRLLAGRIRQIEEQLAAARTDLATAIGIARAAKVPLRDLAEDARLSVQRVSQIAAAGDGSEA